MILNVTLSDGTMFKQFVGGGVLPPKNGVPYYGTWTVTINGSRGEFIINTWGGNEVTGFNPDDSLWVTLLEDGRLDWYGHTNPFRLYAGENGEQIGVLDEAGFGNVGFIQRVP